jgi:hypothetical protein
VNHLTQVLRKWSYLTIGGFKCAHISFTIAATILALTMIFWASASFEMPNSDVVSPNVTAHAANPNLPFQILSPIY